MGTNFPHKIVACALLATFGGASLVKAQTNSSAPVYHIYVGSTHAHTSYTWSHGTQWGDAQSEDGEPLGKKPGLNMTPDGVSHAPKNRSLKPNWQKLQGPPSEHFAIARTNGFDFYISTDHSQEAGFQPVSASNTNWLATKRDAAAATDTHFVALAGYEHSENNGPHGTGHLNVINSSQYLNALSKGVDLQYFYRWLASVPPNGEGPVVATFNHPGLRQYDDWAYRDDAVTDIITMFEVLNSNKAKAGRYAAYLRALDKGWKVSPVSGLDNHGFGGIKQLESRTFVLATNLTKIAILEAMQHRRTYAALEKNIQCQYTVNGAIMGSTLARPIAFQFDIAISDPDTQNSADKITKIDIVKDGGTVVQTYSPSPNHSLHWTPLINDETSKYFFVRVWNADGGDTPEANPKEPVAWLAPIWTGR